MNFLRQRLTQIRDENIAQAEPGSVRMLETASDSSGDRMELLSRDEIRCLKEWLADEKGSTGSPGRS